MIAGTLTILALLLGSAFFSSAEIAATMASRFRLLTRAEQGRRGARRAEQLLEHPERAIITCLVGNTLVNIAMAAYGRSVALAAHPFSEAEADLVATVILVPLVLIIGEALPKAVAQTYPNRTLAALALPLRIIGLLLWPLAQLSFAVARLSRRVARLQAEVLDFLSREELKQFVAHSERRGHVDADERDLIYQIFVFWKLDPARLMRRLDAVPRGAPGTPSGAAKDINRRHHIQRVVVYDAAGRGVIGVLTAKSLLDAPNASAVETHVQPPVRASLAQGIDRLLTALQRSPSQTAVVDTAGSVGIIFLDDLLQNLLGRTVAAAGAAGENA
jgi:CBS domain containing-hemolysin-like protein